jgi:muramoyltetrapeptide carboxypeptidase
MLASRCGAFPFPEGSVLFLEEVGEKYYRIDRMLDQLRHNGVFSRLRGVVLGQFTDCPREDFPLGLADMLLEKMEPGSFLLEGLESGHGTPCFPLVLGAECHWSTDQNGVWHFGQSCEALPIS